MGVVNVTPDSFSDGGRWLEPGAAITHGIELLEQGADILDIGGESTRPGADRPSPQEELDRVIPVVRALADEGAAVSIDTMRSGVAAAALDAGACVVNDVSGGLADGKMAQTVARSEAIFVAMHWRGHSHDMQSRAVYNDVVADVCRELEQRAQDLLGAGIRADRLVLDPGLGFAKTAAQNWTLLHHLDALERLRQPVLVGASRKSFLARIAQRGEEPVPAAERDLATAAVSVVLAQAGVWGVRVHDVRSTIAALDVVAAIEECGDSG
ncbi:dihydropteroate synthase [Leekyejoonella antrihumi]|uniref:Dihydropteroate synthase n=2 Tax=Leekyejoonella antrihumi TaxID=1660198 RepID=A0A563DU30_9MICO|nr:dihydropteroate synthase [Leekyejoonella antrihumi]TWP33699.1 dihydropteroate synthase [Leekyejoonella antrihumi]